VSPYAHPILPLLLDFRVARESQPDAPLPRAPAYPGGAERARWHMREALEVFERHSAAGPGVLAFRRRDQRGCPRPDRSQRLPLGCHQRHRVARLSVGVAGASVAGSCGQSSYSRPGHQPQCFFRHDELSDLIGFTYSTPARR
jgi:hypothetical protein